MITVVGEALIDLISSESGTYRSAPGGAPANTAVALARLGVDSSLLARIGSDRFGRQLRAYVASRGVDTRDLVSAEQPSTLAIANLDEHGHASYDFYVKGTADWQWAPDELPDPIPEDVAALHLGSLAMAMEPGASVLREWAARQRGRTVISYDPNIRPALAGEPARARARVEDQIALADVVKVSDEDVHWLFEREPGPDSSELLLETARSWLALGPVLVAVTRGGEQTTVVVRGREDAPLSLTPAPVEVVDTVGAGDAFCAGLLDAFGQAGALGAGGRERLAALTDARLAVCVEHAHRVAAHTCRRVGADPGELDLAPLEF
ncbi:carbohydrate kinase family protein [Actinorugispora endophytica]|uniref:Fructokinase n=1 Tax=Actinorugispora endophytica TaxID=1605990 RepID=A0A4V3D8M1_9ACTN|nr:carbohydrate kinase [Actinorugispora endophytica]TDQ52399.1 fructokinase [Actinorugispora endophytica]